MPGPQASRSFVLFVYGTLLSGESSHELLQSARALGAAKTAPTFELVDLGPYPALVPGGTKPVVGELYEVTAPALAAIDVYEEHPVFFRRATIAIADGSEAQAYILEPAQVRGRRRIRSGDWRARFRPERGPGPRDAAIVRWLRDRHKT